MLDENEYLCCPRCRQRKRFWIQTRKQITVNSKGEEQADERGTIALWDASSDCDCCMCPQVGIVAEFTVCKGGELKASDEREIPATKDEHREDKEIESEF